MKLPIIAYGDPVLRRKATAGQAAAFPGLVSCVAGALFGSITTSGTPGNLGHLFELGTVAHLQVGMVRRLRGESRE